MYHHVNTRCQVYFIPQIIYIMGIRIHGIPLYKLSVYLVFRKSTRLDETEIVMIDYV